MKSHTTQGFRDAYDRLASSIRQQADKAYERFQENPHHPSLRFKQVHADRPIYSVRISIQYRALAVRDGDDVVWFWIGSHADYDKLLESL